MSIPRQTVQLPSGAATFREAGSGFPVVIIPGLGLTGRFYDNSYVPFSRAGLRLLVPDLPGTGGTPGPRTGVTPDRCADFITEFAHALSLPPALYVGHSLGGQVALLLATRAPRLTAGIALVGPTGMAGGSAVRHQATGLLAEGVRVSPRVIGVVARDYFRNSPVRYIGTWLKHRDPVPQGRIAEVGCPVLLLCGGRDSVIDRQYITLLKEMLADVTAIEIPTGSHALPRSEYSQFNAAVIGFAHRLGG